MQLDISTELLETLFPAFLIVDGTGSIRSVGPSLNRQMPELLPGTKLVDHFVIANKVDSPEFPYWARIGEPLQLKSHDDRVHLCGSMLAVESNYLLAVRHVPPRFSLKTNSLLISDFGPDDPIVPSMLLVGLQQAMIEDSREIALELGRERQRSAEMFDRFSRISGYMAHDFNNLLSIIRLNADRISDAPNSSSRTRRLAQMIAETALRGSEVSSSLMTLSHQRQDSRTRLEPDKLISDNSAFFQTIVGSRIRIEFSLNATGRIVEVSRVGFLNSLINLIVNAREAMPDKGLLYISTAWSAPDSKLLCDHIAIVISDSGHGMTSDVLAKAFEPMYSSKPAGNGMGLASVFEFVNEMGGEVCLESELGKGTLCRICLPEATLPKTMGVSQARPDMFDEGEVNAMPSRIVLVEDEPFALEALKELLESQGHEVAPCASAKEARAALVAAPCHLLLSDVVLGYESGTELAAEACAARPEMQVILMSGYVPEFETLNENWQFIRKPIDPIQLCEMVASALPICANKPEVS